jgi:DNA-binding IclR family transcriptional regulator
MTEPLTRIDGGRQPKAVHSALLLLEAVASLGPGVTAQDLARELNMPAATAYRLINLLVGEEYLVRLPNLSGFALGHRVAELSGVAHAPTMPRAAKEVLAEVRQATRCGVHLAVFGGRRIHLIDPDPDNPPSHPGLYARFPHAVALGKVAMADLEDWRSMLPGRKLHSATSLTVSTEADLRRELREVARRGYASQTDELVVGRSCLALPIRDDQGVLVAGLAASGSSANWKQRSRALIAVLKEAGTRLSPLLS